uniref:S-phase kinase-associated protein 2 n=1 Tax=Moschus moschiferus TaxID=68415 RepID=A0A8C6DI55_MOSMO
MHRKHLQEIPDQSSNVTTSFTWGWDSSKTSELLSGMGVSALEKEEVDSENIPQELLSNLGHPQKTLTQLNLSRYRKNLHRSDVSTLVGRCPNLVHLDLSDSVMLKNDCFPEFYQLNYLQHLSLSRCYDIIPETLLELGEIPTLKTLQVFGIVPDGTLQLLKEALPHLQVNYAHFTTIARPTTGNKKTQEIWGIKCRLSLEKPSCLLSLCSLEKPSCL